MTHTLKDIIATFNGNRNLEIVNQSFANEIIFAQDLSMSVFWNLKFSKINFEKVNFSGSYFTDCQFYRVDLGWSCWLDCIFRKTKFEQVDFEGATLSNLKIKDLIVLNLNFTETFPTKFYKSNSNEFIEVKSQSDFEKILKDINLIISTDQDEIENS